MLTGLSFIVPFTSRLIYTMTDISLTYAFYNTSGYALLTHWAFDDHSVHFCFREKEVDKKG